MADVILGIYGLQFLMLKIFHHKHIHHFDVLINYYQMK